MEHDQPLVTVFMAAYNAEKYIKDSIDSILNQTYLNIELLIIDDGSTDNTAAVVKSYKNSKIRLLQNDKNEGLFYTRNRGIEEAKGIYFAINDADDISSSERIAKQVDFMERNKSLAVCGSSAYFINETSEVTGYLKAETNCEELPILLIFHNVFVNSTIIFRTAIIKNFRYLRGYEPAEDYEIFSRISHSYKVANCSEFLVNYRLHNTNVSKIKSKELAIGERKIIEDNLRFYNIDFTENDIDIHFKILTTDVASVKQLKQILEYLDGFYVRVHKTSRFKSRHLKKVLAKQIFRCILKANVGFAGIRFYLRSVVFDLKCFSYREFLKIMLQSINKRTDKAI